MDEFRNLMSDEKNANVIIHGVPFDENTSVNHGAKFAPKTLRQLSYWLPPYSMTGEPLEHIKIFDKGDYNFGDFSELENQCKDFLDDNKFHLIFGGDHSISIPFQKTFINKCISENVKPVIVHIDAHCDICDEYLGSKYSHACTVKRALDNGLEPQNLFMVGIREFEQDGYDILIKNKNAVNLYTSIDVLTNGLDELFNKLNKINDTAHKIYISFDIDSLDCSYAPGTGTPETCGLTPIIVRNILRKLASFKNVACMDCVEVAPSIDSNDITSWTAIKLIYEFFAVFNK